MRVHGKTLGVRARLSLVLALAVIVAVVLATSGGLLAAEENAGKVTFLKGTAELKRGKAAWSPLTIGGGVRAGDEVRTGKKARVELVFGDQSVVRLGSKTSLVIDAALFPKEGERQFSSKLLAGQAYAFASKIAGGESSFEVKTKNAVAGVRGTAFRVDAKRDKSTVVRVYSGAVAVSNAPIYAKPGKAQPTPTGGTPPPPQVPPRQGVKPGGPGRTEIAGPHEVTKKEWEEFVAQALQEVRVAANGEISEPVAFNVEEDSADEWVAWNKSRDETLNQQQ